MCIVFNVVDDDHVICCTISCCCSNQKCYQNVGPLVRLSAAVDASARKATGYAHTHTHTHVIYTRTVCRYTENIRCEVRCNQLLRRLLNARGRRLQELTQNAKPENDGQKWPVLCDLSALTLFLHSLFSAGGNLSISIRAFLISAPS